MTRLQGNYVGGDQAGRDINKYYLSMPPTPTYMAKLQERFLHEHENDILFHRILDRLNSFCTTADEDQDNVIGLEAKLVAGGFESFLGFAQRSKESFYKKLVKYQLYESAQKILTIVLADVYSSFYAHIQPLIEKSAAHEVMMPAIQERIIVPLEAKLETNVLELLSDELNGALYFLTGNCHIKWV